jgi:hypothetical protein
VEISLGSLAADLNDDIDNISSTYAQKFYDEFDGSLLYAKNYGFDNFDESKNSAHINRQHLYILSDESIKDSDNIKENELLVFISDDETVKVITFNDMRFKIQGNPEYENTVFISTSPNRWWDEPFDCSLLVNQLGKDVCFLACEQSNYDHFVSKTGITLPLVIPSNFTELVSAIQGCKLFVGTLSAPLAIADALHKKRIALQQHDYDSYLAANTNPSFVTYKNSVSNLI